MLLDNMKTQKIWVVDVEANGLNPYTGNELIGIAFYFPETKYAHYLAFGHGTCPPKGVPNPDTVTDYGNVTDQEMTEFITTWNNYAPHITMVGHNTKFDLHYLVCKGLAKPARMVDTMNTAYLVLQDWRGTKLKGAGLGLKWQAQFWKLPNAGLTEEPLKQGLATLKAEWVDPPKGLRLDIKKDMWRLHSDAVAPYAIDDVKLTWGLYETCIKLVTSWGLDAMHDHYQAFTLEVAWAMENYGFLIDETEYLTQVKVLEERIRTIEAKYPTLNMNSPKQLKEAFLNEGIELEKTDATTLRTVEHPLAVDALALRRPKKALTTYLKKWWNNRDSEGVVHSSFNVTGTVTGRLSSSGAGGNLQNIPERAYEIKRVIVPRYGAFLAVDYTALELALACFTAEHTLGLGSEMLQLYATGVDKHAHTRDKIGVRDILHPDMSDDEIRAVRGLNVTVSIPSYLRFVAKTLNFGLLYGGGKNMVARTLHIPLETADTLVQEWRATYPAFPLANRHYRDLALTWRKSPSGKSMAQYIQAPYSGRIYKFDRYPESGYRKDKTTDTWEWYNPKQMQARNGFNWVVQGLGGYLTNLSALRIVRELDKSKALLVTSIHDALDFDIVPSYMSEASTIIRQIMTDYPLNPTLDVAFSWGYNWQDMQPL